MTEYDPESRLSRRRLIVIAGLALLLIGGLWLGFKLVQTWRAATALRADLATAESLAAGGGVENLEVEQAVDLLRTTRADLEALDRATRPFRWLAPHLGWVPGYGAEIQAAPALLKMALNLTAAGEIALEPLMPVVEQATGGEADMAILEEATAALAAARPELLEAQAAIQEARAARESVDAEALDPRLQSQLRRLDRYLPLLEQGMSGALLAPELLGADGPRTYLILVQNEDELRATGGFISGVVQATVEQGQLQELQFEDSYAVDDFSQPYPEPPDPLQDYMLADLWVFRDSNWSPDFPTSAQTAIDLYTISREVAIDGVVALDQQAIRHFVGALGPLYVEGAPDPITGDNVIRMAREAWSPGEEVSAEWWAQRKDFMSAVMDAAIRKLEQGLDMEISLRLAQAARQTLAQKHLLVYLKDEEAAALLIDAGWAGALRRSSGDDLMVVDTNMGFNKVNALVDERLTYTVDLGDLGRPRATLVVHHKHPLADWQGPCEQRPRYDATYKEMMERCYWDYLRIYVPPGAELLEATPHTVPGEALLSREPSPAEVTVRDAASGHQVLATFLLLRPGESLDTRFEYALPEGVLQAQDDVHTYSLTVQKQPGTDAVPIRVEILLPAGAEVASSEPEPASMQGGELTYNLALETDQVIDVTFQLRR